MKLNQLFAAAAVLAITPALSFGASRAHIRPTEVPQKVEKFALEQARHHKGDHDDVEDCPGLNLDDTQKASLRDAVVEFSKKKNTLVAEYKNARMDAVKTLSDANSTKADGTTALDNTKKPAVQLVDEASAFTLNVFYDILKPEQRAAAMKCIMDEHDDDDDNDND